MICHLEFLKKKKKKLTSDSEVVSSRVEVLISSYSTAITACILTADCLQVELIVLDGLCG